MITDFTNIKCNDTLRIINRRLEMGRIILKLTDDYILSTNATRTVFVLKYFDESKNHCKYNRNKRVHQSRVTKNYDFIKQYI